MVGDILKDTLEQMVDLGFALLQAIVVLAVAVLITGAIRRPVRRWLERALLPENAKTLLENGIRLAILLAAFTILLTLWGVSWTTLLTAIGVSTLVVALGLQGTLQSFVAGVMILFERPYNVGDHIWYSKDLVDGTVEEIALRTTVIRSADGDRIIAPNALIFTQAVVNHSPERARLTIITASGVDMAEETPASIQAAVDTALAGVEGLTAKPQAVVQVRFEKLQKVRPTPESSRVKRAVQRAAQFVCIRTTRVRISWSGESAPATRAEVTRRLKELFPDADFHERRW